MGDEPKLHWDMRFLGFQTKTETTAMPLEDGVWWSFVESSCYRLHGIAVQAIQADGTPVDWDAIGEFELRETRNADPFSVGVTSRADLALGEPRDIAGVRYWPLVAPRLAMSRTDFYFRAKKQIPAGLQLVVGGVGVGPKDLTLAGRERGPYVTKLLREYGQMKPMSKDTAEPTTVQPGSTLCLQREIGPAYGVLRGITRVQGEMTVHTFRVDQGFSDWRVASLPGVPIALFHPDIFTGMLDEVGAVPMVCMYGDTLRLDLRNVGDKPSQLAVTVEFEMAPYDDARNVSRRARGLPLVEPL